MSRHTRLLAALLGGAMVATLAPPVQASDPWPAPYKTYAQIESEILAVEAALPEIVDIFSIGESYEGRQLYVAKVSDNVALEEGEPEVLIDALHHGNEHATLAQALDTLHTLADGYASSDEIAAIVNDAVTWIIFAVNPDGLEFDLSRVGGVNWRKNRQPTPGSRSIGTDLNRNYSAYWRCCNVGVRNPASRLYAGPTRFSAPESSALRDFVASRVIDGVQRISIYLSMHAAGRFVAWPIFPRVAGIPIMTIADRMTMNELVAGMAQRNGYRAARYAPTGGTSTDWMYTAYKVPSLLIEIGEFTGTVSRFYPSASVLLAEVAGNRPAILWLLQQAACPAEAAGLGTRNCGPRMDDFERETGWAVNPDGTDTAVSGAFARANPERVRLGTRNMQLDDAASGYRALVTGAAAGRSANANDLDGVTTARSPQITLGADPGDLVFSASFSYGSNATSADWFRVWIETEDGTRTLVHQRVAAPRYRYAAYTEVRVSLTTWANQAVRVVIGAGDVGRDSLVEVAVDDVRVERR
jgi:murein tripeptide amidase MpaA